MPGFLLGGKKKFNGLVNKREKKHGLLSRMGNWRENMAGAIQRKGDEMGAAFEHFRKNGIDGEGELATFKTLANTAFSVRLVLAP